MTQETLLDGTSIFYEYDAVGNRTKKIVTNGSSTTTNYTYNDGDEFISVDGQTYTYDVVGNPATMTKNGTTYYYHVNGHGDVTTLTDENGSIVAEYSYDAWGNILSQTGSIASENPYRYAGYRYDETTELYYLMERYYNSEIGRFITIDSFYGFAGEPITQNKYAYPKNNPVIYIDSSENVAVPLVVGGILVALAFAPILHYTLQKAITNLYSRATRYKEKDKYKYWTADRQEHVIYKGYAAVVMVVYRTWGSAKIITAYPKIVRKIY